MVVDEDFGDVRQQGLEADHALPAVGVQAPDELETLVAEVDVAVLEDRLQDWLGPAVTRSIQARTRPSGTECLTYVAWCTETGRSGRVSDLAGDSGFGVSSVGRPALSWL